ncbi:hypothetical protein E4U41_002118 [Claviceps citrina]|nr:hypothetical protein E4U41_002118 [Claviceps citrina]
MDPGLNGSNKRPRLASWPASASVAGTSLPHPRPGPGPGPYPYLQLPYPPRPAEHAAGPSSGHLQHPSSASLHPAPSPFAATAPVAASAPMTVHGHAQSQHSQLDRRHLEQQTLAPMQDYFQQSGPPPQQQQKEQQHKQTQQQQEQQLQQLQQLQLQLQLQPQPQLQPQLQQQHHQSQSSTPALPPYHHSYPPRCSVIKRESGDENWRSNPAGGHAPDSVHHTIQPPSASQHHHPPPPPPPPPPLPAPALPQLQQPGTYSVEGQQRHMTYENGPSVAPIPGVYRPSTYQPPIPPPSQPPYESLSNYPPVPEQYYGLYAPSSSTKKKSTRASQACEACRSLKAKCDERLPCKICSEKGTLCVYREPVPKATDKAQADILEGLSAVQSNIASLLDHVRRLENHLDIRLSKLESDVSQNNGGRIKSDLMAEEELQAMRPSPFEAEDEPDNHYYNGTAREYSDRLATRLMADDELEQEPGEPVLPGEPAIPINHTTLAGLLLNWPVIRDLVKPHLETEGIRHVTEYPISKEQNRGVLILYGRGEDSHISRPRRERNPDHGQLNMGDDSSDTATSSPLATDWGHLGGLSPADQAVEYKGGVLTSDGNPDFSEHKVWNYVQSFEENMLNMHPIVQPDVVRGWIHEFLQSLPPIMVRPRPPNKTLATSFAVSSATSNMGNEMPGAKRKRSPDSDGYEASPKASSATCRLPERTIHNALVLIILALGKICLFRERIPDAVHQTDARLRGSSRTRNGLAHSPSQGSPPGLSSGSQSSGLASPQERERGFQGRRSSVQGHGSGGGGGTVRHGLGLKKNYEAIPGLEYFALASDILGNHIGSYKNLKNVHALIFAGLYYGQLARPMESFAFIHQAGHKLQAIIRPCLDKLRRYKESLTMIQDVKYNQLALAFWTCLQLESDLIAELQLPPSGLLSYEGNMPPPNMSLLEGFDQKVLDSYPAQLYLRKHLNSIHRMFYAPDKNPTDVDPSELDPKFNSVGSVVDAVSGMTWVAKSFAFKEDDPPAQDLLSARLRAKYWGAQVITYRPFIRQILHWSDKLDRHPTSPNDFALSEFRRGVAAPVISPSARSPTEISDEVKEYAKRGIKALLESTRAFHNLGPERPIITNVFGTAHAQWGNLLVLSACSKNSVLREWVPMDLLEVLFARTISFLRQSSTLTGSLRSDMHILEGVSRSLFGRGGARMAGTYSSHDTSLQAHAQAHGLAMGALPADMSMRM